MNTEIKMLLASAVLALLHFLPYMMAYIKHWGMSVAVGNRDNPPPLPAWANRSIRAHRNMTENLVHFTAIIVVTQFAGLSNDVTALGATVFFYARALYLLVYTLGIPWVRTMIFMTGVVGELMIVGQLVTLW